LYSSGALIRPSMLLFSHSALFASPFLKLSSAIGVIMCPGLSALTRIPPEPSEFMRPCETMRVSKSPESCLELVVTYPFHGKVLGELDYRCLGGIVHGRNEAPVGDGTAHGRDKTHRALDLVLMHLTCAGACRKEDACVVDQHHLRNICRRVVQRRCDLLNCSRYHRSACHLCHCCKRTSDESI
jgi:hypothetical protein